jgi:acyl-CoA thioester hydrolase
MIFVVRRMGVEFVRPAKMDDVLEIETRTVDIRGASINLAQRILCGFEVLVTADVQVAALADGRPVRIPDAVRDALDPPGPR